MFDIPYKLEPETEYLKSVVITRDGWVEITGGPIFVDSENMEKIIEISESRTVINNYQERIEGEEDRGVLKESDTVEIVRKINSYNNIKDLKRVMTDVGETTKQIEKPDSEEDSVDIEVEGF